MARMQKDTAPAAQPGYTVVKREKDRGWEVRDPNDELVRVTVYKCGAVEVARRLAAWFGRWRSSRGDQSRSCCAIE